MAKGKLFGTDGIRGTANLYPMTAEMALKFGTAAAYFFSHNRADSDAPARRNLTLKRYHHNRVVIAKDTRISGYMLESAVTAGFISMGWDVILVGPMPTPAVPFLINSLRADLGLMISASHNEYYDNGLKLFGPNGEKLDDQAQNLLETLILDKDWDKHLVAASDLGKAKRLEDAPGRYIEAAKTSLGNNTTLQGIRIVLDCANGAAYKVAPTIFWELGAEVIEIATEPNGFNINNSCGSNYPLAMQEKVKEVKADIGIALDGDADRVVICDENGELLSGDHLIGIIAHNLLQKKMLKGAGVAITIMSNMGLERYLNDLGLKVYRTKVGDRYIYDELKKQNLNFGGEQSGHIILRDYSSTGDGIIAAIQLLNYIIETRSQVSSVKSLFPIYPQIARNITFNGQNPLEEANVSKKLEAIKEGNRDLRFVIRKSGTEKLIRVMVEGKDERHVCQIADELVEIIKSA